LIESVVVKRDALEMFLKFCLDIYPKENIMIMRGKIKNGVARVDEFLIPPFSTYGSGFSGFSTFMVPFDMSYIGAAHSHPSGNASPSPADLNHFFGRVMMIAGYPYHETCVRAYNSKGDLLLLSVE
jgi:proteasome lid subunit RPN8/RPN11